MDVLEFVSSPELGFIFVVYTLTYVLYRRHIKKGIVIIPIYEKSKNKTKQTIGVFYRGGTATTSKAELRVRNILKGAGYSLMERELNIKTPVLADGKEHNLTPDILVKRRDGKIVVVEYDSFAFHSARNEVKMDLIRQQAYAIFGFPSISLRTGGKMFKLGKWDVCAPSDNKEAMQQLIQNVRLATVQDPEFFANTWRYMNNQDKITGRG